MQLITQDKIDGLRPSVYSSLAMAFAGIGDAFLYPFLPIYSKEIGVPAIWIGVLLSINRFVRIFLSPVTTLILEKFHPRQVTIVASYVAMCCTIGYGLDAGVIAWILLRSLWGLCFSALRVSVASFAFHHQHKGLALGLSNGMYEIGPLIALSLGPVIVFYVGIEYTFYVLALLSSMALYFSHKISGNDLVISRKSFTTSRTYSSMNILTFLIAFTAEGLVIIVMTVIIQRQFSMEALEAASISSGMLILRRICTLIVSPVGGMIIDWFGSRKILFVSVLCLSTGVVLVVSKFLFTGLILIFVSYPISNAVVTLAAVAGQGNQIRVMNHQTVFKDAGAATGTLFGGFFLFSPHLNNILLTTALLPILIVITFIRPSKVL